MTAGGGSIGLRGSPSGKSLDSTESMELNNKQTAAARNSYQVVMVSSRRMLRLLWHSIPRRLAGISSAYFSPRAFK